MKQRKLIPMEDFFQRSGLDFQKIQK